MNTVDKVKQCRTPQEALLVLAQAIDELAAAAAPADPWEQPLEWAADPDPADDGRARIEDGDVVVDPVSPERQAQRRQFADDHVLHAFYGDRLSEDEFLDAYVKGGPRWLYYTDRACIMQMPVTYRQQLVADVLLDSPSEADEIGRDILKFNFEEGAREQAQLEHQREARDHGAAYKARG